MLMDIAGCGGSINHRFGQPPVFAGLGLNHDYILVIHRLNLLNKILRTRTKPVLGDDACYEAVFVDSVGSTVQK